MRADDIRNHMVNTQVLPCAVDNRNLLMDAMRKIPREPFVPEAYRSVACMDRHIPLEPDRIVMAPRVLARLLQALDPKPDHMVLDVACASGYSTAILAFMVAPGGFVVGLETHKKTHERLVQIASENLTKLEIDNAVITQGDLQNGLPQQGPYDLIFMNSALQNPPQTFIQQLTPTGRLVAILKKPHHTATAYLFHKGSRTPTPLFEESLLVLPEFTQKTRFVL